MVHAATSTAKASSPCHTDHTLQSTGEHVRQGFTCSDNSTLHCYWYEIQCFSVSDTGILRLKEKNMSSC